MRMTAVLMVTIALTACVSVNRYAQKVRVTSNPDVVKGCEFLVNGKAMSGWGGAAGSGVAARNIEETLKQRTWELRGDTVYVVRNEGSHGTGEPYRCSQTTENK